jgi:polysaccharide export outer membrane protein
MKVSSLVGKNEDLLPETYYNYALIEREAEGNREPVFIRFDLGKVISGDADEILQPRDRIYIFNRSYFRPTPMVSIGDSTRSGYSASHRKKSKKRGESDIVRSPGFYELKKGMRVIDLILASGGLSRDAFMDKAELYRIDFVTKKESVVKLNLNKVLERDNTDNILLQDLDHLVVHSVWEFETPYNVTISGEVNTPGTYPLAEGAVISDLIFTGGSLTEKAYRKKAELTRYTIIDGEKRESYHSELDLEAILAGDPNSDLKLQPYDHLHILKITNWRVAEKVTITGEVRFPGVYPIEEGEMLADLIDRAGGFTEDAFLYGARFNRKVIARFQKKQFNEMADKLEADIARVGAAPVTVGVEKDLAKQKFAAESLMQLVEKLRRTKPDGRLVIRLMEPEELRKSRYNIILHDGDVLHVPKKPDSILVLGEVYNPTAFLFEKGKNSNDYIKVAGGLTQMANKKAIYVIKADGSVIPSRKGFFRNGVAMGPGDVVVVPEELKLLSRFEMTKDITQILYQLGLAAAAYKTVGLFD